MRLFAVIVLLGMAAGPVAAAADPQDPPATGSVSAGRIHEGLQRPELEIPPLPAPATPTFRVDIEGERPETPLEVVRRELQEEAQARAGIPTRTGLDLMPAIMSAVDSVKNAWHARAEAQARERVSEDFEQFCASHDCSQVEPAADPGVIVGR